jgi:hypothetical protein
MSSRITFLLNEWGMIRLGILKHPWRYRLWVRIASFKARLFHPGSLFRVHSYPSDLIYHTQQVWAKRLGREVPKEEALEIIRSFKNFLSLLREIKQNGK